MQINTNSTMNAPVAAEDLREIAQVRMGHARRRIEDIDRQMSTLLEQRAEALAKGMEAHGELMKECEIAASVLQDIGKDVARYRETKGL